MLKFIEFLKSRPKDRTIRIMRIIFGLIILALLGYGFNDFDFFKNNLNQNEIYAKCTLFLLGIIPIVMGIDFCFAKRKHVRIIQIIFGVMLIFLGNTFDIKKPSEDSTCNNEFTCKKDDTSKTTDIKSLQSSSSSSKPLNVGFFIALLGIFPIIAGITGKCITQKCYKYGEVITKIRV